VKGVWRDVRRGTGILHRSGGVGHGHLLKRTRLKLPVRIALATVLSVLAAVVLVWASVCASILLYQLNDSISW